MPSKLARRQLKVIKTRIHYGMRVNGGQFRSSLEPYFTVMFKGTDFTGVLMVPEYIRWKIVWTGRFLTSVEGWNGWPGH